MIHWTKLTTGIVLRNLPLMLGFISTTTLKRCATVFLLQARELEFRGARQFTQDHRWESSDSNWGRAVWSPCPTDSAAVHGNDGRHSTSVRVVPRRALHTLACSTLTTWTYIAVMPIDRQRYWGSVRLTHLNYARKRWQSWCQHPDSVLA